MTHPFIRTGRSLVGMVLVLLGLSTFGCGDTGTQSDPAELGNLSVSDGTLDPRFNPATTSYVVQLSTDVSSTTITASPRVAGDTIRIDNQPTSSQTVTLDSPGAETSVNIVVTETGTGGTSKSYTVRVKRAPLAGDNSLASLTVSPGTIAPPFSKNSLNYTVSVENNIGSITVTPTLSDPLATMTVNGQAASSGQGRAIDLNRGGQVTTIQITITAQDRSTKSYEVAVSRGASNNNFLSGLTVSSGSLDPTFRADRTAYAVNVGSGVESVTVRPTLADTTATLTVNGQAVTSGQQSQSIRLNPPGGSPTIVTIIVISQKGEPKPYSVTFNRAALNGNNSLRNLSVTPGSLDFKADDLFYTVNVGSNVSSITVNATKDAATASVSINGVTANSRQISLPGPDSTTRITIRVTAENGRSQDYIVDVKTAALGGDFNLQSLTVPPHTLSPTFSQTRTRTDYDLEVNSNVDSVTVSATPQDSGASIKFLVNNAPRTNPISLPSAPSTTEIEIEVTAPNGQKKSYFITVTRTAPSSNVNLLDLSVTAGSAVTALSPPFDSNTVNVAPEVGEVVVRATKDDANATMALGSVTVPPGTKSGQATFPLNGAGGDPTTISFTVTAQNGVDNKTYTISVIRPAAPTAPAKPATAPDLIAEDDSCPLVLNSNLCFSGSNTDNITNVKRPRFRIPQPPTGQTPSLYIDTNKDASASFDAGTNTLRPSADLSDGNHTITYTLTNSVGESAPSPSLTVTIDTGAPVQ